jgi:hypothetical protein
MRTIKHIGFNTTCIVLQIKSGDGQTKTQQMDLMKNAKDRRDVSSTDRFPGCVDVRCTNHFKKTESYSVLWRGGLQRILFEGKKMLAGTKETKY